LSSFTFDADLAKSGLPRGDKDNMGNARESITPKNNRHRRGAELLEFSLAFLPLMSMLLITANIAWAVFAKSALQRAVRMGVRTGVTLTAGQMTGGACLTDTVKATVQQNALGLLSSSAGLAKIKVHYLKPPDVNSTAAATDVSTQLNGNQPGNIMVVSVEGFSLVPILPRIYVGQPVDKNPLIITVSSADRIEPSRNPPCIGTAP
jgi:Flp pilus assembly protein TadG